MHPEDRKPANTSVRVARHVYNPIGFSKGYNFTLFFITVGALFGFALAQTPYLDFHKSFCPMMDGGAAPGECYWYLPAPIGMQLHLFGAILGSLLASFQFVPIIRHKLILLHRINEYIVIFLVFIGIAGGFMILRHAFGGDLSTQTSLGAAAIMATVSLVISYYNIKGLQIDQHRAWMIRAWAYLAIIITIRLVMIINAVIVTVQGNYYQPRPCAQIEFVNPELLTSYSECEPYINGTNLQQYALVNANPADEATPIEIGVALGTGFALASGLALLIHVLLAELYLWLTPAEGARSRQVSYRRQAEGGLSRPGYSGLTVERFGYAYPWLPKEEEVAR